MTDRGVDRSVADFVAGALSPPLIMALVGSLVFFLVEILYDGYYRGSLQWVLFFFVFGAVLVSRIAMQGGQAAPYGLVLGGLVWFALRQYVDYSENPVLAGRSGWINLGLIVVIWWSAHCLTRDCTYLGNEASAGGAGLLDEAGLDSAGPDKKTQPKKGKKSKKLKPEEQPGVTGWWHRYAQYREQKKAKPRTLGLWVVFFFLAALPLFGLGQAQIPVEEVGRRRYAFSLLMVYVGAGLGLLLTTSFLGLRSYLRERKVTMPLGITVGWLFFGGLLIGAHLFASTLLPRPADPQPLWDWTGLTSAKARKASLFSPFQANERRGKNAGKFDDDDEGSDKGVEEDESEKSKDGDGDKSGPKGKSRSKKGTSGGKDKKGEESKDRNRAQNRTVDSSSALGGAGEFLAKLARWIAIGLVVLIVIFFVGGGLLRFLANFTLWAQKLLALFAKFQIQFDTGSDDVKEPVKPPTPRPFASFSDPFLDMRADSMSPADLVRYSFAALQAWGRENDLARAAGETALEHARRIGKEWRELGEEAAALAGFYARLAYSTDTLSDASVDEMRGFWQLLGRRVK